MRWSMSKGLRFLALLGMTKDSASVVRAARALAPKARAARPCMIKFNEILPRRSSKL